MTDVINSRTPFYAVFSPLCWPSVNMVCDISEQQQIFDVVQRGAEFLQRASTSERTKAAVGNFIVKTLVLSSAAC